MTDPVVLLSTGDVVGPNASTDGTMVLFDGTSGKKVKGNNAVVTVQGLALLDDADAAANRATIGLDQVNNTSDINKPVSTAAQTALNGKQPNLGFTAVQQGTGIAQTGNTVKIGWDGSWLRASVDASDLGRFWTVGNFTPNSKLNIDSSQAAGFASGDKALPYIRHADSTVVYLQVARPKDTALLTANGWSKNADTGEIIQWCEYAVGDAQGATSTVAVTWPFQFPTQCLNMRMDFRVAAGSPSRVVASSYPPTLSGTTVLIEESPTAVQSGLVLMVEVRGY